MPESIQHKLDRVRRPRVQITYDVETLGSIVKTELPFVVGIMADLSGNALSKNENKTLLKDRKFVEIDRDNFNQIMENVAPTVKVDADELTFTSLEDFDPINVLRQVSSLNSMFESRTRLSNLVAKLDGNVALQKQFVDEFNKLKNDVTTTLALQKYYDTLNPTAKPKAWAPTVPAGVVVKANAASAPIKIGRNEVDSDEVTHFKIGDPINGGKLFKKDGTTEITATHSFITFKEGQDGVIFKPEVPTGGSFTGGSFKVFASINDNESGLSTESATVTIFPLAKPDITITAGNNNEPFTVKIKPNRADAADVQNFKLTEVTGGALTKGDGTALDPTKPFVTKAEGQDGLKFTPAENSTDSSFKVQSAASDQDGGVVGEPATATLPVKPAEGEKK